MLLLYDEKGSSSSSAAARGSKIGVEDLVGVATVAAATVGVVVVEVVVEVAVAGVGVEILVSMVTFEVLLVAVANTSSSSFAVDDKGSNGDSSARGLLKAVVVLVTDVTGLLAC